jgi:glycosyl transferase, family 25
MNAKRYIINLKSRPDRRSAMLSELGRVGWEAEFVTAERPKDRGPFPSIGARGCFESHLEVLRRGLGSDIILMEDDLNFDLDFGRRWPVALAQLPSDWSIFYPAHDIGAGMIEPSTGVVCTHMMVFRSSVVGTIIKGLEAIMSRPGGHPLGGPMHVDGAYSTIRAQNPEIKTYGTLPALGYQRSSRSDISPSSLFIRLTRRIRKSLSAASG